MVRSAFSVARAVSSMIGQPPGRRESAADHQFGQEAAGEGQDARTLRTTPETTAARPAAMFHAAATTNPPVINETASEAAERDDRAQECEGRSRYFSEEADRDHVHEAADEPLDAVFADAVNARVVLDRRSPCS